MKRYGNLFPEIIDTGNIIRAFHNAAKGKTQKKNVAFYLASPQTTYEWAKQIQYLLLNDMYRPSHVSRWLTNEHGKVRTITSAIFYPDQIVHWAIMQIVAPIFRKSFIHDTLSCLKGRGGYLGQRKLQTWLRNDPHNTKYVLKTDIHHFYQSIDHDILKQKLRRYFKDPQLLHLLDMIIDCYSPGLPLGLYTSQWFANMYLNSIDHKIKQDYHIKYYLRYMDDQVLLGSNKKYLHQILKDMRIDTRLEKLQLKPNWQVWKLTKRRPIDFLGLKFYRDHTTIRGRDFLRINHEVHKIMKYHLLTPHHACAMISYYGWEKHTDSFNYYQHYIKPYVPISACTYCVSHQIPVQINTSF